MVVIHVLTYEKVCLYVVSPLPYFTPSEEQHEFPVRYCAISYSYSNDILSLKFFLISVVPFITLKGTLSRCARNKYFHGL